MTVDTEVDPDQTCPKCGTDDILPRNPNDSSTTGVLGNLQFLGLSRKTTIGHQYLHVEYYCPDCDHEFFPRSDQDQADTKNAVSSAPVRPSDRVVVLSPSGERELGVEGIDAHIQIELPNGEHWFDNQVILDAPVDSDRSLVVYDTKGYPIGLVWASSEVVSIMTPFP
ncbi:hypothetical protein [Halalkalicoccus paucihalophilus]|uniref:hypothetical protein n=1 Tax=Halalkalicoccus paucihalophilus TaxID=1008153 RepID=UPI000AABFC18|nr:hypothetical protein [Halalkalicoccus paucihalophilus]